MIFDIGEPEPLGLAERLYEHGHNAVNCRDVAGQLRHLDFERPAAGDHVAAPNNQLD
jgi:hypothetical protein